MIWSSRSDLLFLVFGMCVTRSNGAVSVCRFLMLLAFRKLIVPADGSYRASTKMGEIEFSSSKRWHIVEYLGIKPEMAIYLCKEK